MRAQVPDIQLQQLVKQRGEVSIWARRILTLAPSGRGMGVDGGQGRIHRVHTHYSVVGRTTYYREGAISFEGERGEESGKGSQGR